MNISNDIQRIFSFIGVGAFATLCYAAMAFISVYLLDIPAVFSSALAYALCIPISFFGQKNITFGDKKGGNHVFLKFVLMQLSLGLIAVLVTWLVDIFLSDYAYIGIIAACIIVALFSFLIMSKNIFTGN